MAVSKESQHSRPSDTHDIFKCEPLFSPGLIFPVWLTFGGPCCVVCERPEILEDFSVWHRHKREQRLGFHRVLERPLDGRMGGVLRWCQY